jgi:hypothetical protein
VDTARILRTGGVAALTFGQMAMGTPPATLLLQRRAVAAAAAPTAGLAGQNLDLALMLADGSDKGMVDPAFEAHLGPIGHWAQAVWNRWLPLKQLFQLAANANVKLAQAIRPWSVTYGPAAAFVGTAARLQWVVHDAVTVLTDAGRTLRLDLDPPAAVAKEVKAAVRRWRWRTVEGSHHSLFSGGAGRGATMDPLWKLLRSNERSEDWNPSLRGALRSAIAGRQWPQARCFRAGFAVHPKCLFCVYGACTDSSSATMAVRAARPASRSGTWPSSPLNALANDVPAVSAALPPPTQQQLDQAPVGTCNHRVWHCPRLAVQRRRHAPEAMLTGSVNVSQDNVGTAAFERALFASIAHDVPPPTVGDTFTWVVEPAGGTINGVIYTDGSRLDGRRCWPEMVGLLWPWTALGRSRRRRTGFHRIGSTTFLAVRLGRWSRQLREPSQEPHIVLTAVRVWMHSAMAKSGRLWTDVR